MNDNLIKKNYLKKTKLLNKYNKFYYDKNNPAVNDQEYDQLKKDVLEIDKVNLDKLSQMALEDPSTAGNPKKLTKEDMKIMYEHSLAGKLF